MKEEPNRNLEGIFFKVISDCIICPSVRKTVALKEGAQPKWLFHKHYVLINVNWENHPTDLTTEHNNVKRGKENHNKIICTK